MDYDIIGDIHGHHDKLVGLLGKLGYGETAGAWRHPSRQAIFVGDFIDRGPHQLETLNTVRRMVDAGSALAIMGNHEFNAMAWYTEDPHKPGTFLRPRDGEVGSKNREQHEAFLAEIEHHPSKYQDVVNWFYTLPLWLDLPGLRVVHACWHERHMQQIQPRLAKGNCLTPDLLVSASRWGSSDCEAVESILKGIEVPLPGDLTFKDKGGHVRKNVRVRWWNPDAVTFREAAIMGVEGAEQLPLDPIPEDARIQYPADKPVLFGHYWMSGQPTIQTPVAACVDYSAAKKGPLVAYRWNGEPTLRDGQFVGYGN